MEGISYSPCMGQSTQKTQEKEIGCQKEGKEEVDWKKRDALHVCMVKNNHCYTSYTYNTQSPCVCIFVYDIHKFF